VEVSCSPYPGKVEGIVVSSRIAVAP
jgi:hypothetical protein